MRSKRAEAEKLCGTELNARVVARILERCGTLDDP
jgi:hypothetical protein